MQIVTMNASHLPDILKDKKYYNPGNNKMEGAVKTYMDNNPHSVLTNDILDKYPNFAKIVSLNEEKNIS